MRERERKSRSQIAQQAARDTFMEQASGAVFAEPIKVSRWVRGHRVTAGRGAPVIRRARPSLLLYGLAVRAGREIWLINAMLGLTCMYTMSRRHSSGTGS